MKHLQTGQFHGQTNRTISLDGITLTDTEYTLDKVDWHYHENAYFTFILEGKVIEGNKKEVYNCDAGSLLFHNWQEPHYNIKPPGFTRGFHIELTHQWIKELDFSLDKLTGSLNLSNPELKFLLYKIFRESKADDMTTALGVQTLLLQLLSQMERENKHLYKSPVWVGQLKELLHDTFADQWSLTQLSAELGIHPVHLSRDFSKYFHCTIGEYIRKLKVEKSLSLLSQKNKSLADIAFECGFADPSHFGRCFKAINGINALEYRKNVLS
ncbi:helix-turn-helix domain-containing protein [Emticicia fontis]